MPLFRFPEQVGSKTDIALLEYIEKCGFSYKEQRNSVSVIKKIPFNSSRKRMSVIIESGRT
jgi:magnesium-transporting ATPase (P-type)